MNEFIVIAIMVAIIALLMKVYISFMTKRTKLKLGVAQILNDGCIVESMYDDIEASSELPFNGNRSMKASLFTYFLELRESGLNFRCFGIVSSYLFKWELEGIIKTEIINDVEVVLSFDDEKMPTKKEELELYEVLKSNDMARVDRFDAHSHLLENWGKKLLGLGEQELLESGDVAFDQKNRIRFTRQGYDNSLSHLRFEKYFIDHSPTTFEKLDAHRQQEELSYALYFELWEEIADLAGSNWEVPEVLKIADRVWRVLELPEKELEI